MGADRLGWKLAEACLGLRRQIIPPEDLIQTKEPPASTGRTFQETFKQLSSGVDQL